MRQTGIQQAVYNALIGNPYVSDLVDGRIYDNVPQGTDYPYIVIGDDTTIPWDTDTETGSESTLTLHVWSRYYGRYEVKAIMEAIYTTLHRREGEDSQQGGLTVISHSMVINGVTVQVPEAHVVLCEHEFSESFLDPDGITRHGVIRFRIVLGYNE